MGFKQPDLFDAGCLASDVSKTIGTLSVSTPSPAMWNEVPQALFLSWPVTQQLAYCAARDEDAAINTYDDVEADFYRARAARYREMMHEQR